MRNTDVTSIPNLMGNFPSVVWEMPSHCGMGTMERTRMKRGLVGAEKSASRDCLLLLLFDEGKSLRERIY